MTYCDSAYDCAEAADALVIATEWEQFRALDLERLRDLMACPVVIDLRNIYRPEEIYRNGFAYSGVGRPVSGPTFEDDSALDRVVSPDRNLRAAYYGPIERHRPQQIKLVRLLTLAGLESTPALGIRTAYFRLYRRQCGRLYELTFPVERVADDRGKIIKPRPQPSTERIVR